MSKCDMCHQAKGSVKPRLYGDRKHEPVKRCDECHAQMLEFWGTVNRILNLR